MIRPYAGPADLPAIHAIMRNPRVLRWMGGTREDIPKFTPGLASLVYCTERDQSPLACWSVTPGAPDCYWVHTIADPSLWGRMESLTMQAAGEFFARHRGRSVRLLTWTTKENVLATRLALQCGMKGCHPAVHAGDATIYHLTREMLCQHLRLPPF